MITAIGTGIGDEFDLAKLRYHRVIVMTDADVDGSHIRTLILTFLYRQMPELIERGHVYIAAAPLYKVKLGNQEFYFEKDAPARGPARARAHPARRGHATATATRSSSPRRRWAAVHEGAAQYDGYSARLRADFGIPAAELMIQHRLVEHEIERARRTSPRAIGEIAPNGYELSSARAATEDGVPHPARRDRDEHRAQHHRPGRAARLADLRPACARPTRARRASSACRRSRSMVGKETEVAETFDALRAQVLDAAKQGIQISRFKGLGEMNAEQLWETTMDPAKRLLIRVDVEDARAADRLFSMLMGDEVEPRREFIEQNAKDVKFLDV